MIPAVIYVTSPKGNCINWLAITSSLYDNTGFGIHTGNKPFHRITIEAFLLQMVQLQAVSQGFSTNMYVQANMSTEACVFYKNRGFVKTADNNPKEMLPSRFYTFYKTAQTNLTAYPYIHFVTDEEQELDWKE